MSNIKECVLTDRGCTDCGECNICDLDKEKICDNCCKCIDNAADYKKVEIDEIVEDENIILDYDDLDNWKYDDDEYVDYSSEEDMLVYKKELEQ